MPSLTRFYGLKPWDIDRMSLAEISEYRAQFKRYQSEQGGHSG